MNQTSIGSAGQWLAVLIVTAGIAIEIKYEADLGFVLITAGSLILALATKIKYYRR